MSPENVNPTVPVSPLLVSQPTPSLSDPAPKNKIAWPFIILAAVLLLGVGGFFAWQYFNPTPQKVLQEMREKVLTLKTVNYSGSLSSNSGFADDFVPESFVTFSPTMPTDGSFAFFGKLNIKENNQVDFDSLINIKNNETKDEILSVNFLSFNDQQFLKVNAPDDYESGDPSAAAVYDTLGDAWLNLKDLENYGLEDTDNLDKTIEPTKDNSYLKEMFIESDFFEATEKLANEKVSGVNCYHYSFDLNKEKTAAFLSVFGLYTGDSIYSATLMKVFGGDQAVTGEIWVGSSDRWPHRLIIRSTSQDRETNSVLDLSLSDFNLPVSFSTPEKVMSADDFFTGMIDSFFTQWSDLNLEDSSYVDTDGDGLTDTEEADFGSDPNLTDTDADGLDDLNEWFYDADPNNSDTDSDGVADNTESENGTDLTNPADY